MSFVYTPAMNAIAAGTLPMNVATYKVMLLNAAQTANKADQFVSTHLSGAEIGSGGAVTNYTRGYGGSGRKAVSLSLSTVTTNPVGVIISANIVWSALGGAVNDTIVGAALVKEITNDAASLCIAYWDISPSVTTNGSDFTITVSGTGNITFTT